MMVLVIGLLTVTMSILFVFTIIQRQRTKGAPPPPPPGPPSLPLIGNLHQIDKSSPHRCLWQLSKHYGPLMSLRLGFVPTLVVSSAKMARQVLKTHDLKFASRPPFLGLRKLSYNGLDVGFAPYSDYWRQIKKVSVLHLFSSQRVQSFRPIREHEVARMISRLSQSDSHDGSPNKVINLTEALMSFTSTLICRIAFGKDYGHHEELLEDQLGRRSRLQVLLNEAQSLLVEFYFSDHFQFMGWVDRLRGLLGRLDKTFKELDIFYNRIIHDHMDPPTSHPQVADIIHVLLRIIHEHDRSFTFDLTLDHIKAIIMNIFMAGTDTTAVTVVWAVTALVKNPKAMNKIQEEIRNLFGEKDFINEDDIQRLPYLKAVVKETLRLFPASPLLLPRETTQRCNIEGYEIQPKTLVLVNAWAIARDPESWEDPEEFCPERFIGSSIDFKGQDFEFIPFGAGRRMCPAINMGVVTVELALANLLHSFDWELPNGIEKEYVLDTQVKPGITMHKKNDLCLVAKKHIQDS